MKTINYTRFHGKTFSHFGNFFRLVAHKVGARQLVAAECLTNPDLSISDLMHANTKSARIIKTRVKLGLVG